MGENQMILPLPLRGKAASLNLRLKHRGVSLRAEVGT